MSPRSSPDAFYLCMILPVVIIAEPDSVGSITIKKGDVCPPVKDKGADIFIRTTSGYGAEIKAVIFKMNQKWLP